MCFFLLLCSKSNGPKKAAAGPTKQGLPAAPPTPSPSSPSNAVCPAKVPSPAPGSEAEKKEVKEPKAEQAANFSDKESNISITVN
ncbi:hypothetical protein D918_02294 [Trichuris suis]|nr:hypothetical protein D918_02294 [Trichuris suis]